MADSSKRGFGCEDDCDSEKGERGKRGKRGHRGHDGRDGKDGRDGFPIVTDPSPPTLRGDGSPEDPLQVINVAPQPFTFPPEDRFIYVRAFGNDQDGDGSEGNPFRSLARAAEEVPLFIPGGVYYYIDCTDLIDGGPEITPPNYALPCWKSSVGGPVDFAAVYFQVKMAVNIFANPRLVASLGPNAIITDTDLLPTDVGGGITSITGTNPIEVTTTNPHLLWATDFGAQDVTIDGVPGGLGGLVNGNTFSVRVPIDPLTQNPYPDRFIIDIDGSAFGDEASGSVSTLFVKDQFSGQVQVKTTKNFGAEDSLVGKMFIGGLGPGGSFEHARIWHNTADTLFITNSFAPIVFPDVQFQIMEPSCKIATANTEGGYVGGFNVNGIDSIAINGIEFESVLPFETTVFQNEGTLWMQGCTVIGSFFAAAARQAGSMWTHFVRSYYESPIYNDRNLQQFAQNPFPSNYWFSFGGSVYDRCAPIEINTPILCGFFATKVIDSNSGFPDFAPGPAFRFFTGNIGLDFVSLDNVNAVGLECLAPCNVRLNGVNGTGVTGNILLADTFGKALVTDYSFTQPGDTMTVGDGGLPDISFANWHAGAGCPPGQYTDITAVGVDGPGATGTMASVLRV